MKTIKTLNRTGLLASALISAALLTSPLALADHHGGKGHHGDRDGKRDYSAMCDQLEDGKGRYNSERHQQRREQRYEEMAERLQLTEEQRTIWQEIHNERQQMHQQRMQQMQERCANADEDE